MSWLIQEIKDFNSKFFLIIVTILWFIIPLMPIILISDILAKATTVIAVTILIIYAFMLSPLFTSDQPVLDESEKEKKRWLLCLPTNEPNFGKRIDSINRKLVSGEGKNYRGIYELNSIMYRFKLLGIITNTIIILLASLLFNFTILPFFIYILIILASSFSIFVWLCLYNGKKIKAAENRYESSSLDALAEKKKNLQFPDVNGYVRRDNMEKKIKNVLYSRHGRLTILYSIKGMHKKIFVEKIAKENEICVYYIDMEDKKIQTAETLAAAISGYLGKNTYLSPEALIKELKSNEVRPLLILVNRDSRISEKIEQYLISLLEKTTVRILIISTDKNPIDVISIMQNHPKVGVNQIEMEAMDSREASSLFQNIIQEELRPKNKNDEKLLNNFFIGVGFVPECIEFGANSVNLKSNNKSTTLAELKNATFDEKWLKKTLNQTELNALSRLKIFQSAFEKEAAEKICDINPIILKKLIDNYIIVPDANPSNLSPNQQLHINSIFQQVIKPIRDKMLHTIKHSFVKYYSESESVRVLADMWQPYDKIKKALDWMENEKKNIFSSIKIAFCDNSYMNYMSSSDTSAEINTLINSTMRFCQKKGHLQEAIVLAEELLKIEKNASNGSILNFYGVICQYRGLLVEAKDNFSKCLDLKDKPRLFHARVHNSLGTVMQNDKDWPTAEYHHRQALRLCDIKKDDNEELKREKK